jgi:hypothetical protein
MFCYGVPPSIASISGDPAVELSLPRVNWFERKLLLFPFDEKKLINRFGHVMIPGVINA